MLGLLSVVALVQLCSAGGWMGRWLRRRDEKKGSDYDFEVMGDFIRNSSGEHSSVFSPICSGMNDLLQGCSGEYGPDVKEQAMSDLEAITEITGGMDKEKLKALNKVYIPENRTDLLPVRPMDIFMTYTPENTAQCEGLLDSHKSWVLEESNQKVQSPLEIGDFKGGKRIYTSMAYFKDQWQYPFNPKKTLSEKFYTSEETTVYRDFMKIERYFLYYENNESESSCKFKLAAVPYACAGTEGGFFHQHDFTRYAIYLVPEGKEESLDELWKEFARVSKRCIKTFLNQCEWRRKVRLEVPKIVGLKSELNLNEILKKTYGDGPAEFVESKMMAYINVDEKGTEAAAFVSRTCTDGPPPKVNHVRADRRHILLVYDKTLNRILFAVKDMGGSNLGDKPKENPVVEMESSGEESSLGESF